MIIFRELLSIIVFLFAIIGICDSVINGVDYGILILSGVFFFISYLIWPSKRRGKREKDNWVLEMFFEFIIELPIEFVKFLFRMTGRIFGKSDADIDLDI